jgi:large subunit ribosomal protein L24
MHVKKGDNVIVLTGKDKGKTGKILRAFPREDKVWVDGVNVKKVHERAKKASDKGKVVEKFFPVHVSNVRLSESKAKK